MEAALTAGYHVKSLKDLKHILKEHKNNFELRHVSQELVQNILDRNQSADLFYTDRSITLVICSVNGEIEKIYNNIDNGIRYAKECQTDPVKRKESLHYSGIPSRRHGRGFLSILFLGWDLGVSLDGGEIILRALKT